MKLLLTNDDGYGAPGIEALHRVLEGLGERIIVAPDNALSGCSHQVTTHAPLKFTKHGENRFSLDGTPADCVRVALHKAVPDLSWVISGINAGGNLGADVYHSGTVAAVREAVLHGKPGIAVSHYRRKAVPFYWDQVVTWLHPLVKEILLKPWREGTLWNINVPHLDDGAPAPAIVQCPLDPSPLPLSFRTEEEDTFHYDGNYHARARRPGCDVEVCLNGSVSVTELHLF